MRPDSLLVMLMAFADRLRFKGLFMLILVLFLLDLIIPDMIPMIDEIILGLFTLMLANIKKESVNPGHNKSGNEIEGEVVNDDSGAGSKS